jgi:hypothetical protein
VNSIAGSCHELKTAKDPALPVLVDEDVDEGVADVIAEVVRLRGVGRAIQIFASKPPIANDHSTY